MPAPVGEGSPIWAKTLAFSNNNLLERLRAFCGNHNIELVTKGGKNLARLNPRELNTTIDQLLSAGTYTSGSQRLFALLEEIESSCEGLTMPQAKKPLKIPAADLVRLQNRDDRRMYFCAMTGILLAARQLETNYSITLETEVKPEPGEEGEESPAKADLLRIASRQSLVPLLDHLKDLAAKLTAKCKHPVTVSDIRTTIEQWLLDEETLSKFLGKPLDLDTIVFDLVK